MSFQCASFLCQPMRHAWNWKGSLMAKTLPPACKEISLAKNVSICLSANALSITFSTTLTLPGHSQNNSNSRVRKKTACTLLLSNLLCFLRKWLAKRGRSSFLSGKAGRQNRDHIWTIIWVFPEGFLCYEFFQTLGDSGNKTRVSLDRFGSP